MNKLTKASIAGAAGIALLLGGAGTLALWNDTATIAGGDITSGTLYISDSTGSWDSSPALWVPGDSFTYTGTVEIEATGTNLAAELSVDTSGITGDTDFANALDIVFTASGTGITLDSPGVYSVTPNAGTVTANVTVVVTFPTTVSGTTAQDMTVDLDSVNFLLQQVTTP